jgi:hypothetical protein
MIKRRSKMKNNIVNLWDEDSDLFQMISLFNSIVKFDGWHSSAKGTKSINQSISNKLSGIELDLRRIKQTVRECIDEHNKRCKK